MRRSLRFRLLALSLTVALGAVAATAVLATYSAGEQLQGEIESSASLLESDQSIHGELTAYATEHASWDGVGTVVAAAAERTGRRIALTDGDGRVIADSARDRGAVPELPSVPAATIDVASPSGGAIAVMAPMVKAGTAGFAVTAGGAFKSAYWRLTDEERVRREQLAKLAHGCLLRAGLPAELLRGPDGVPTLSVQAQLDSKDGVVVKSTELRDHPCIPAELYAPSALSQRVNRDEVARASACLDEAGVPYKVNEIDPEGLRTVLPAGDDKTTSQPVVKKCLATAQTEALRPYVAPTAKLYLGTSDRFNVFSTEGLLRTAATALGVLLLAALVTVLAGRRLVRPILALTGAAQRMTTGDRAARVPVTGNDEVARLGHAFNAMASSIEHAEQQRRAMVSDVAHDLRTPLSNIKGYLEATEDGVVPLDRALVSSLLEETTLLERLVSDLQELALADAGMLRLHPEERDLAELAQQTVAAHRAAAETAGVSLTLAASGPAIAMVDPARIRQALGNLVANAVKFTPAGGSVTVSVQPRGSWVDLVVSDTGPGIAAEHLPHLFDRFYRADPSRSRATGGSGLGLAITKHLIEAHSGQVSVTSTVGRGSTFGLALPRR
jgi:two-component system sensor histidine kinase BaeS